MIEVLPVFCEPPAAAEPSKGSFNNPSARQDLEALRMVGPLHDFGRQKRQSFLLHGAELPSLIAAVRKELLQKWKHAKQSCEHETAAIAVLNAGRMNERVNQQALRIDENVPLLALDLLSRVVTGRIDRRPPFSALFTLWLSMIAAVGLASREACSRHFT